ncbi:hypothetical protein PMIN03_010535 [Paraphaeosphaeria minitans]
MRQRLPRQVYKTVRTGINNQGNRWSRRDDGSNTFSWLYLNRNGSLYYVNADGSTYWNDKKESQGFC